jgi:GNAT superfamily N-acetyltransferase
MTAPTNAPEPLPTIRKATERDLPALTRLINAAFVVEQIAFDGDRVDETGVHGYMSRGHFLLAENSDSLVGCVFIEQRGDRAYLGLLSVQPFLQGRGLGRLLVAAAEQLARSLGARHMDLRIISPRADQLLPFYQRLGYTFIRNEPYPPDVIARIPSHYLLMSKPLA